ncbi:MAG: protein kinase domain-containing protein [Thermoanaerobaculaceae bacterium]
MMPPRVGRYEMLRQIGRGGMGTVYLAYDPELSRHVAIKGLTSEQITPERRERLRREARAAAALTHPNIAQVYDVLTQENQDFVIMEYVEGKSLAAILEEGPLSPGEVARIGVGIAQALAFAHRRGILHRDIKTENVIIGQDGTVKVLDFGLARWLTAPEDQRLTQDGLVVGTSRAMSPEQATGKPLDFRSDIFSLGSLLYEAASGQPAFSGETVLETMHKVARAEFVPLRKLAPHLPERLVSTIERCLEKDPNARFQDALEVAKALADATATLGTAHIPSLAPTTFSLKRLRRKAIYAVVALGLLSGLLALALQRGWISAPQPLTVAVLPIAGQIPEAFPLTGTAVAEALTSTLATLTGLQVVAGREVRSVFREGMGVRELALALGVEDVIETLLTPTGDPATVFVELRRIEGASGRIRWSRKLEVGAQDPALLTERLGTALVEAFSELRQKRPPRLPHKDALVAYLTVQQRLDAGLASPNYQEEIALLRKAEELDPDYPESFIAHASIERFLGTNLNEPQRLEEAEKLLIKAAKADPNHPLIPLRQAQLYRAQGNHQQALDILRQLTSSRPGDPAAWAALGATLASLGRAEESEKAFARALALQPAITTWDSLSSSRADRGDFAGARQAAQEILRRAPNHPLGLFRLGYLSALIGDFATCEKLFAQLYPTTRSPLHLLNWGTCAFYGGDLKKAAHIYQQACELAPEDPRPWSNLGDAYLWLGDEPTAKKHFQKAYKLLQKQPSAARPELLAHVLAHLNLFQEAVLQAQKAVAAAPDRNWNLFVAAEVAALAGDRVSMLAYAKRARELAAPKQWFQGPEFAPYQSLPAFQALFGTEIQGGSP